MVDENGQKGKFNVKAVYDTDSYAEILEAAVNSDKGIAIESANKLWIIKVDDNGDLSTTEKTE